MSLAWLFALDVAAIAILAFGLYFPRHRRREMVVAYLSVNIGVLGVTQALSSAEVSAGLGLGLFGVLSIIRLRSSEMDQSEVAYYFAALALGLLGGFALDPAWMSPLLMGGIVVAVAFADHPGLFSGYRNHVVVLDHAYPDEARVRVVLEELLGAPPVHLTIRKVDFVNDSTVVDVRYRLPSSTTAQHPDTSGARS